MARVAGGRVDEKKKGAREGDIEPRVNGSSEEQKARKEAEAFALTLISVIESRPRREPCQVMASILIMTSLEISDTR